MTNAVGVQELIERIKDELREAPESEPMFRLGQVIIDISFTVERGAEGGIDLKVVQAGVNKTTSETQNVKVVLHPIDPESSTVWRRRSK